MSTDITNRPHHIIRAFAAAIGTSSVRDGDALAMFSGLAGKIEGLTSDELAGAADEAKRISRELRALAWRVQTAEANAQRRGNR
jgi:hypothetical protein